MYRGCVCRPRTACNIWGIERVTAYVMIVFRPKRSGLVIEDKQLITPALCVVSIIKFLGMLMVAL